MTFQTIGSRELHFASITSKQLGRVLFAGVLSMVPEIEHVREHDLLRAIDNDAFG